MALSGSRTAIAAGDGDLEPGTDGWEITPAGMRGIIKVVRLLEIPRLARVDARGLGAS
jgi:hypothetical protein